MTIFEYFWKFTQENKNEYKELAKLIEFIFFSPKDQVLGEQNFGLMNNIIKTKKSIEITRNFEDLIKTGFNLIKFQTDSLQYFIFIL